MWKRIKDGNKIWYELQFNSKAKIIQGTKYYNPLEEIKKYRKIGLTQIHSAVIQNAVEGVELVGDGIYTEEKNVMIYIKTSDCLPIIFYNPEKHIIALLHSGWKGTLMRIVRKFILKMKFEKNILPSEWIIAFGPSIDWENYPVGEEIERMFSIEGIPGIVRKRDQFYLDLISSSVSQLDEFGIAPLFLFPEETYKSDIFFSRRRGDMENQITAGVMI